MKSIHVNEIAIVHFDAGRDRNGNPRRFFAVVHPAIGTLLAIDEGYEGEAAIETHPAVKAVPGLGKRLRTRIVGKWPTNANARRNALRDHPTFPEGVTIEL